MKAGGHFGHHTRYWNPKMEPYIFGKRDKIHIIDLDQTMSALSKACAFVRELGTQDNTLLFVGTKRVAREVIVREAQRIGMPYVNNRWLGGMLTNYKTIRGSVRRLTELREQLADPLNRLGKKERLRLTRQIEKLERSVGGIKDMEGLPEALFVVDVEHERIAISEAMKLHIPVVAVVDTNSNPDGIDHVIPGNDDSARAVELFVCAIADACQQGREQLGGEAAAQASEDRSPDAS